MNGIQASYAHANVRKNQGEKLNSTFLDSNATNIYTASANTYVQGYMHLANRDSQKTEYKLFLHDTSNSAVNSNALVFNARMPKKSFAIYPPPPRSLQFGNDQQLQGLSSNQAVVATLIGEREDR